MSFSSLLRECENCSEIMIIKIVPHLLTFPIINHRKKSVFVSVSFYECITIKISGTFSLSSISIPLFSQVCAFLSKIIKMCSINIFRLTIVFRPSVHNIERKKNYKLEHTPLNQNFTLLLIPYTSIMRVFISTIPLFCIKS